MTRFAAAHTVPPSLPVRTCGWLLQVEHGWTMEAFDHLLEAWVLISQDPLLASIATASSSSSPGADGPSSVPGAASSADHHHLTASDVELQVGGPPPLPSLG